MKTRILTTEEIDQVVRKETCFESLQDMCNRSLGTYTPTLRPDLNPLLKQVAEAYDIEMIARGSRKRAFIG